MLAGALEDSTGKIPFAWSITFLILAGLFIGLCLYHKYILPVPKSDKAAVTVTASTIFKEFFATFVSFSGRSRHWSLYCSCCSIVFQRHNWLSW